MAKKKLAMTDDELAAAKKEGMSPELSKDVAILGTRELQIRTLWYGGEELVVDAITDAFARAKEINADTTPIEMAKIIKSEVYKALPRTMAVIFEDQGITLDWLAQRENRVTSVQMWDVLQAQIEKNGLSDRLGKLLKSEGLLTFALSLMKSRFQPPEQPKNPQ